MDAFIEAKLSPFPKYIQKQAYQFLTDVTKDQIKDPNVQNIRYQGRRVINIDETIELLSKIKVFLLAVLSPGTLGKPG